MLGHVSQVCLVMRELLGAVVLTTTSGVDVVSYAVPEAGLRAQYHLNSGLGYRGKAKQAQHGGGSVVHVHLSGDLVVVIREVVIQRSESSPLGISSGSDLTQIVKRKNKAAGPNPKNRQR